MEAHPIPRQITTFEFKLIGFLTLKQFAYLALFVILGFVSFMIVPMPFVNIFAAGLVGFIGVALAFIPINGRPLDIWIKNFVKKIFTPSQFFYHKRNPSPEFLKGVRIYSGSQLVQSHIDAQQKLTSYMKKDASKENGSAKKDGISKLIRASGNGSQKKPEGPQDTKERDVHIEITTNQQKEGVAPEGAQNYQTKKPFLFGVVKNNKNVPLPNILVYIKNTGGQIQRILKTNHNGVFATYHLLLQGDYGFELKDLGQKYFFDTMTIAVDSANDQPISIFSKEII